MEKQNSLETGLSEARSEHDREKKALERQNKRTVK